MLVMFAIPVVALFIFKFVLGRLGDQLPNPLVTLVEYKATSADSDTLIVFVPGFAMNQSLVNSVVLTLTGHGNVVVADYPASFYSNANGVDISRCLSDAIQRRFQPGPNEPERYKDVMLVGYSMGALISRKALLFGYGATTEQESGQRSQQSWAKKVSRVVLLAGTNRGWDISGKRPLDMGWIRFLGGHCGSWFADVTKTAKLIMQCRTGAPFVADLRLEWMRWYLEDPKHRPFTVQLLGDIDDVVSDEDNKDLGCLGGSEEQFAFIKVRGSGHSSIIDFDEQTPIDGELTIGQYRRSKLVDAITKHYRDLSSESSERLLTVDRDVKRVVFVLHGIRDYGIWSAGFEKELQNKFRQSAASHTDKLAISSNRYGYFGMGPFLLTSNRQKFVRWFMDAYTETIAHYPNVEQIDFVGHSYGTYILASALDQYHSLKVHRVVFGGSVVRKDYDWKDALADRLGKNAKPSNAESENESADKSESDPLVRNYVASDDWVVACLPRLFEYVPLNCVNNDLGRAGFFGFTKYNDGDDPRVENVRYITGGHPAMLRHIHAIADFVIDGKTDPRIDAPGSKYLAYSPGSPHPNWVLEKASRFCTPLLWGFVLCALFTLGMFFQRHGGYPTLAYYLIFLWWFFTSY